MTGVHHFLNGTQLDAVGQIGAEGSYHIVLDRSPPDYVEKISRYLSSSMGQGTWDKVSNGPAEADSDSGDSLFITQKEATLPEDVRPDRLHQYIRDLEEGEGGSSSTSHSEDFKTPKWRRKKYTLPKYSFPFLEKHNKKLRSTRLPDQYKSLHDYTLGGFFKCLGELRQSSQRGQNLESSLPTVDMDGEHISPLSEEDGERSEDEDVKVVERKHFLVSSKRMSQQTWCNQLKRPKRKKDNNAGPETSGETKMSPIKPNKKSSCRVLVQSAREASTPVAGQAGGGPPSQRLLHGLPDRTKVKKKRKKERSKGLNAATSVNMVVEETPRLSEGYRAAQTSDVLGINVKNGTGASSGDNNTLRRVKGDVPDSKQKKKNKSAAERKKRKGRGEDAEQLQSGAVAEPQIDDAEIQKKKRKGSGEDAEQLQSGIVTEPQSDDAEMQKKKKKKKSKGRDEDAEQLQSGIVTEPQSDDAEMQKKKKKKKSKGSGEDAEPLQSGIVTEPQSDEAEIQKKKKKKKRKKELGIEIAEEHEEEETSNGTLDLPPMSTEQLEASRNCFQEPLGSSLVKRKKRKKKQQSSDDATQGGEEGVDVSFCLQDSVTMAKGALKKKRSTFFEELNVFHTPKEKFENVSNQKTNEGLEDQIAESVTKKKKKKEIFSRGVSEDKVAQSDDSVSAREKGKKRHSSFLVADAEESCAQTRGISPSACRAGAKRKKERTGSESEGLDSAADTGLSAKDEAVVLKKKKRKCNSVIIEGPPAATTCSSVSRKKKGKCDASAETLTSVECDLASSEMLNDTRDQKKKKKKKTFQNDEKSLAQSEPGETRGKQRSEQPVSPVMPEAPDILRKKHKRKLLNPTVEFFSDS
ncbi:glutamic acid-rich protein-like [Cyclopterus lumpus]|uniref:glutamic acid-rich protein-like n=1 Tax=Cyclopterus lumpus TaxID=8103 RepID=UPI001486D564|nr:glutamic acid-rich protein-like [Cyclopterus lumpus]